MMYLSTVNVCHHCRWWLCTPWCWSQTAVTSPCRVCPHWQPPRGTQSSSNNQLPSHLLVGTCTALAENLKDVTLCFVHYVHSTITIYDGHLSNFKHAFTFSKWTCSSRFWIKVCLMNGFLGVNSWQAVKTNLPCLCCRRACAGHVCAEPVPGVPHVLVWRGRPQPRVLGHQPATVQLPAGTPAAACNLMLLLTFKFLTWWCYLGKKMILQNWYIVSYCSLIWQFNKFWISLRGLITYWPAK